MSAAKARLGQDPAALARVTVTRAHHPLVGQPLRVLGRMRRHGRLELLLELADGSKRLIPAAWTDQSEQPTPADAQDSATATLGSVWDLLAVCGLVSALAARARAGDDRGQAARQSPSKEDSRAACAAQSGAGPGSGATGDPVSPAPRTGRRGGDHTAGPPDRQSIHPGHDTGDRAASGHAGGLGTAGRVSGGE
jgi:Family of unknown function (DUF5372)